MQSESSDLRCPTAASNAVVMCWGAARARLRLQVGPRAAQSSTWSRVPMPTSQSFAWSAHHLRVEAQSRGT